MKDYIKKGKALVISILFLTLLPVGCAGSQDGREQLYAGQDNWAYCETGAEKDADVFLICPTVFWGSEQVHNMPLTDEKVRAAFLGSLNMERGIYEDSCRLYAPYYRQASLNVYQMEEKERERYLDLAYKDVRDAFLYYMEHYNEERPVIIAGFSQGADMSIRLTKEFFQSQYQDQLVAVYAIGWRLTEEELQAAPGIRAAQGEKDTGCIVLFNSEAEDVTDSPMIPAGMKTLAINPLNWKTDATPADASQNLGACFTNYSGTVDREEAGFCGAYLDEERGALKITGIDSKDYPPGISLFEDGVYHIYDYQFFYRNLQQNVKVRLTEYLKQNAAVTKPDEAAQLRPVLH